MKLTCAQILDYINAQQPMVGAPESETFLISLIQRNVDAKTLPDYLSGIQEITVDAFQSCSNLALTELPESVLYIQNSAFFACSNLALKSLPKNLIGIYPSAFAACDKLAFTTIPKNVRFIQGNAFDSCKGFTNITFEGTPSSISVDAFDNCTNLVTINVPWSEGEVANAPWGATNATINYNYTGE